VGRDARPGVRADGACGPREPRPLVDALERCVLARGSAPPARRAAGGRSDGARPARSRRHDRIRSTSGRSSSSCTGTSAGSTRGRRSSRRSCARPTSRSTTRCGGRARRIRPGSSPGGT
jgi:hypothetical protein